MTNILNQPLYGHQIDALKFHLENKYSICGFEVGLGKTPLALALCAEVKGSALIVCPAYLKTNWKDEIEKFIPQDLKSKIKFKIVGYPTLLKLTLKKDEKYNIVIFDEVHYLKNINARRTSAAHNLIKEVIQPDYMLGLTGTPIKNRVPEWWSLMRLCGYKNLATQKQMRHFYYDFYSFCDHFSNRREFKINGCSILKYEGHKNLNELIDILTQMFFKKESQGLPERVQNNIIVKAKDVSKTDFQRKLELDFVEAKNLSQVKAINALAKAEHTILIIQDFLDQDIRPVVFTDHIASCELIASHFKVKALTGKVDSEIRAKEVASFEKGFSKLLVCTIGSMSTGHNIISTNQMIFNDFPWVPSDIMQAEGRIRRLTQTKTCFYHYVFSGNTDLTIFKTLKSKIKTIKEATTMGRPKKQETKEPTTLAKIETNFLPKSKGLFKIHEEIYFAQPEMSKSDLDKFLISPKAYKAYKDGDLKVEKTPQMLLGSLVHTMYLEPDRLKDEWIKEIKVDKRTKTGKAMIQEFEEKEAKGKIIVSRDVWDKAAVITLKLINNLGTIEDLAGEGNPEISAFFTYCSVSCRGRIDYLANDHTLWDLKTTSDLQAFSKSVANFGYHRQAALYSKGYYSLVKKFNGFKFIVVETKEPYDSAIFDLDIPALTRGKTEVEEALYNYSQCAKSEKWHGIYDNQKHHVLSLPKWY